MKRVICIFLLSIIIMGCKELKEKGSIAGKVTNGGKPQKDVIVLAIEGDSLANGDTIDYTALKGALTGADGNYKIFFVEEGSYVVVGINDKNNNFVFDDTLDEIGYYGKRDTINDSIIVVKPEKVYIAKGEDKTGIDIDTLYILPK